MGKKENKYLDKRVKDERKKGLDTLREVKGIARAIFEDYTEGKISYKLAMRRLNFLKLIVSRDRDFRGNKEKKEEARRIIESYKERVRNYTFEDEE